MIRFKKTELANGIRVVSEFHSDSLAVSLGVWVQTGTRDEIPAEAGISHFLEHMVFKGTKTRSAYQIAKSLEALGGDLNAFTTREYTCYHSLVLKDHWPKGLDVLSDLVTNMSLKRSDFQLEKSVILQEIAMSEDNLEELVYDIYLEKSLPKHPLGRPILGTEKSISEITQKQMMDYYRNRYCGSRIIVSAAGNVDHQELVERVEKLLGSKKKKRLVPHGRKPRHRAFRECVEKSSEQLHLLVGLPCASFKDKYRFEAFIVNTLLGGGMTSKLYQSVREKRGLVYTIYSSLNTFMDFGLVNVYAACDPKNMKTVLKLVANEFHRVKKAGVTEGELELFKTQVIGSLLLGSDDIENRMQSIAINEMVFKTYKPTDAIVSEIQKVTVKSVNEFIKKYFEFSHLGILLAGGRAEEHRAWLKDFEF